MEVSDFFNPPPPADALIVWVIYRRPKDVPSAEYVVRPQYAEPISGQLIASHVARSAATLEEARQLIPRVRSLYQMERQKKDDPVIVETWF